MSVDEPNEAFRMAALLHFRVTATSEEDKQKTLVMQLHKTTLMKKNFSYEDEFLL